MVFASTEKVVLGSIAYVIFWVLAVFPAVPFLPIGRTAGSLLGGILMVIFKAITPTQAYAAIDLPILGPLFGTMVVSIYLEKADMFKYLGILVSWKSKGAKDLLCRVCVISAISSTVFTNDTSCVVLTEFVLKIARLNNIPPHPFLLALVSSTNIGSSATPIGNPQNLVIAIQSGIPFVAFLLGRLPAMVVGVFVNALILLCMNWKLLSIVKDEENALDEMRFSEADATSHQFSPATMSHGTSHRFSPATMSHVTSLNAQEWNSVSEAVNVHSSPNLNGSTGLVESLTDQINLRESNMHGESSGIIESTRNSSASKEEMGDDNYLQMREEIFASRRSLSGRLARMNVSEDGISVQCLEEEAGFAKRWMRLLQKASVYSVPLGMLIGFLMGLNISWIALTAALTLVVLAILVQSLEEEDGMVAKGLKKMLLETYIYLVTIGMLITFLMGLDMSWTALAAALTLVVIDFKDARLFLEKVSYSLLVFFCGMFITVDGFNRTGIPSLLWSVIEPHARISHVSGIVVLAFVILILSNIASNVPTVLLLGARVAASAAAISPSEEKKAWFILAWMSTVAGNMSLLGSAANLIVCEQARNSEFFGYTLSFWNHLKFGIPSTLMVTAIGLTRIRG